MGKQLIILTAGENTRLMPLTTFVPKALISYAGKPAIFNMIIPLIKQGFDEIIFVCNRSNIDVMKKMLKHTFGASNVKMSFVIQTHIIGPGNAVALCKQLIKEPTMLLLADTQCEIPVNYEHSWVGTSTVISSDQINWCVCTYDQKNNIIDFFDKPKSVIDTNQALIGMYYFHDAIALVKSIDDVIKTVDLKKTSIEISYILKQYMKYSSLKIREFNNWSDIGTLSNYHKNNRKSFVTRNFNHIELTDNNVLTKKTDLSFDGEREYLNQISGKTKYLFPRLWSVNSRKSYSIEYFDYSNLSEYFVYYPINEKTWVYIFNALLDQVQGKIWEYKSKTTYNDKYLHDMYLEKVKKRLNRWSGFDTIKDKSLVINGQPYCSFNMLWREFENKVKRVVCNGNRYWTQIHGDFILSNILYSLNRGMFVFVDPRGEFGIKTLNGDCRYDMAKMRQCYHGKYDFIINDLFDLYVDLPNGVINYSFYSNNNTLLCNRIDGLLRDRGFNIDEIEIIEATLFLSMISLHNENPDRQIMFYITALNILDKERNL